MFLVIFADLEFIAGAKSLKWFKWETVQREPETPQSCGNWDGRWLQMSEDWALVSFTAKHQIWLLCLFWQTVVHVFTWEHATFKFEMAEYAPFQTIVWKMSAKKIFYQNFDYKNRLKEFGTTVADSRDSLSYVQSPIKMACGCCKMLYRCRGHTVPSVLHL